MLGSIEGHFCSIHEGKESASSKHKLTAFLFFLFRGSPKKWVDGGRFLYTRTST